MDGTMQAITIMQEFGWTYEEYLNAPAFVLTLILEKMKRDRKAGELDAKRLYRGN